MRETLRTFVDGAICGLAFASSVFGFFAGHVVVAVGWALVVVLVAWVGLRRHS